jgi:hypothetical protein
MENSENYKKHLEKLNQDASDDSLEMLSVSTDDNLRNSMPTQ